MPRKHHRDVCRLFVFSLKFFFGLSLFSFFYLFAAVIDLLLGLFPVQKILRKHHRDVCRLFAFLKKEFGLSFFYFSYLFAAVIDLLPLCALLSATSKQPPMITKFAQKDLVKPNDVTRVTSFKLPCEASGTNLTWTWKHNDIEITNFSCGIHYSLSEDGTLIGKFLSSKHGGTYQCFVKDEETGVEVFSRKLKVAVTGNQ